MARFCENCGAKLEDGELFCKECGTKASQAPIPVPVQTTPQPASSVSYANGKESSIMLGADGKYRWAYELNMLKNPVILYTLLIVIGGVTIAVGIFVLLISMGDNNFWFEGFLSWLKFFGLFLVGMLLLASLGYLLYALILGFKYCVVFEMDDATISHIQQEKHVKKAEIISALAVLSGIASGDPGMVGTGLLSLRNALTTTFANVKTIKSYKKDNIIFINETLNKNQIYVSDEDFDFVLNYLIDHCPKAKTENR